MKTISQLLTISALFLLFGCQDDTVSDLNLAPDLIPLSSEETQLVNTANDFSFDLFRALQQGNKNQNLFFSPFSVDVALHMTANGATGDTKTAMQQVLGTEDLDDAMVNGAMKNLSSQLAKADAKVTWNTANAIWFQDSYTLENNFRELIQAYYDGRIEGLDFGDPGAKDVINGWVADRTQGKIENLIENLGGNTVMVLTNAVYFQANWQYRFDASQTQEAPFYLEDGTETMVPMMFSEGVHLRRYYEEDYQLLEIPYGNGQYTMVVMLPNGEKTVDEVVNDLTAESLATRLAQSDTLTTQLYLPKFKMEFKTDLVKTLTNMGMEVAFSGQASFGGFFADVKSGLFIDQVVHQAFLEVNEAGSEAAAATAVVVSNRSDSEPGPSTIRVDRPFVLLIRERHTGAVLFAGKVMRL